MDSIVVQAVARLMANPIAGAKNACLALMPATLLSEEPLTLTNAPRLSDIKTMTELLQAHWGRESPRCRTAKCMAMSCHGEINTRADYDIVRKMRASILCLGRFWRAKACRSVCPAAARLARVQWTFTPMA